jgi:predicted HD phosphohydrolase
MLARYESQGAAQYGLEAVSQLEHALQCAHLAELSGAPDALVAAALLHDVGHLLQDDAHRPPQEDHAAVGSRILGGHFGPAVVEPVRLHAEAKRWLLTTEPFYEQRLSAASRRSLRWQGHRMTEAEAGRFLAESFALDAISLRRWDDRAKEPGRKVPPLLHYRALLDDLLDRTVAASSVVRSRGACAVPPTGCAGDGSLANG